MKNPPAIGVSHEHRREVFVWLRIKRVHNRLSREEYALLSNYGLTPAQFEVLSYLASEPGLSQQMLADRLLVTKGNVCGLVDRLENAGLVERQRHPDDRRSYQLYLTEPGNEAFQKALPCVEEKIAELLHTLADPEQEMLSDLLARLDESLK